MAGFESWRWLGFLSGRFSGLRLRFSAASSGFDPVVTSLAGFAGTGRPQAPGARMAMPAAFRYALPVSRRTPVACSIRRKDQPKRPNAITCCRFSSLKTLLMPTKATLPSVESTSRDYLSLAGFEVAIIGRFWVATEGLAVEQLKKVDEHFWFELSSDRHPAREFIVTAEGHVNSFPIAEELVRLAPKTEGWTFIALKPAQGFQFTTNYEG